MKCFKHIKGVACGLLVATISMSSVFAAPLTFTELPSVMDMPSSIRTDVGVIATNDGITVTLNGETISFPDQQPIILNDRLLVPLRPVLERMGAKVDWNEKTKTATFERNGIYGELKLGSKIMKTNVGSFNMDVAPLIYNNRTMIPIRYPVEVLGGTIAYSVNVRDAAPSVNQSTTFPNTPVSYGSDAPITPTPQPTSLPTTTPQPTPQPTSLPTTTPQPTPQPTSLPTTTPQPTPQPTSLPTTTPQPTPQPTSLPPVIPDNPIIANDDIVGSWISRGATDNIYSMMLFRDDGFYVHLTVDNSDSINMTMLGTYKVDGTKIANSLRFPILHDDMPQYHAYLYKILLTPLLLTDNATGKQTDVSILDIVEKHYYTIWEATSGVIMGFYDGDDIENYAKKDISGINYWKYTEK